MPHKIKISRLYLFILLGLVIYEFLNYIIHVGGWSIFSLEQLAGFREWISFSDVDRMLTTQQYAQYAASYAEFMVFGAATFPLLIVIWLVGLVTAFPVRDYSPLTSWLLAATLMLGVVILSHTDSSATHFFGIKSTARPPFWYGMFQVSTLRFGAYVILVFHTAK